MLADVSTHRLERCRKVANPMIVFHSLGEALRAGFHVEDRAPHGYVVRTRTQQGWARAIVVLRSGI